MANRTLAIQRVCVMWLILGVYCTAFAQKSGILTNNIGKMNIAKEKKLDIGNMLKQLNNKNKSTELTTAISVEEVTMTDVTTDVTTVTYDNATDDFTDFTENVTFSFNVAGTTQESVRAETTTLKTEDKKHWREKFHKMNIAKSSPGSYCSCDLTKSVCDVNCCCDSECTEAHRSVFTECIDEKSSKMSPETHMLHQCHSKDTFFFMNNTPWLLYQEHITTSHLFCVIKDNMPPRLMNDEPKIITSIVKLDHLGSNHFQWGDRTTQHTDNGDTMMDSSKPYSYHDNVWIITNSSLKIFELPTATLNKRCNAMVKMKYLTPYKSKCQSKCRNNAIGKLFSDIDDTYVVASPYMMNQTWLANMQDCPQNICIPITTYVCDDYSCLPTNETSLDSTTAVFTSLKLYLYSNGSSGYTNATAYFGVGDSVFDENVEQEFEVHQAFISKNSSLLVQELGGNPGYQNGRPVIVSRLVDKQDNNTMGDYFNFFSSSSYPLRNILSFPKNKQGYCVLSNFTYDEIRFRENVEFNCRVVRDVSMENKAGNATKLCILLQDDLLKGMLNFRSKIYVAKIGNPSTNQYDWIELLQKFDKREISGIYNSVSSVTCSNMVSKFDYKFVYATVDQPDVPKQSQITGAVIKYISQDITYDIVNKTVTAKFSMTSRFVDVTKPQPLRYASGPHFHIRLPQDFFYPFAFNRGSTEKQSHLVHILILSFAVFCF